MHPVRQSTTEASAAAAGPVPGVEPGPGYERIADELAVLVAREHALRVRAESAADALAIEVSHARRDLEEVRGIAEELSVLLADEKAAHDEAVEDARRARERADAEASWRRRFKTADRRERRRMLDLPPR
jgi:hypothetical protein